MTVTYSARKMPSVPQLLDLYQHAWWTKKRKKADVAKLLRHPQLLLTAWEGRTLVGFARVLTDFVYRAVIADVIVRPGYFGRGIGTKVVRMAVRDRRLKGVAGFWLYTTDKQAFYKKMGFKFSPKHLMLLRKKGAARAGRSLGGGR